MLFNASPLHGLILITKQDKLGRLKTERVHERFGELS